MSGPRVFLSYSHDSPTHKAAVLKLAQDLRTDGFTSIIDQDHPWVSEGWTTWMMNQIEQADFVLMICTEIRYTSAAPRARKIRLRAPAPPGRRESFGVDRKST